MKVTGEKRFSSINLPKATTKTSSSKCLLPWESEKPSQSQPSQKKSSSKVSEPRDVDVLQGHVRHLKKTAVQNRYPKRS